MRPLANSRNADKARGRDRSLPIARILLTEARLDRRFQGLAATALAANRFATGSARPIGIRPPVVRPSARRTLRAPRCDRSAPFDG